MGAWRRSKGKWRRKIEMWDEMIKGLKSSSSKKSATINKLKEDIGHLEHELHERDDMVKYLKDEVEVERRESGATFERAWLARQHAETLQDQLKEEVNAHETLRKEVVRVALEAERQRESSLAEIQALQGHLNHLKSEAYRVDVVEKYRNITLGKVEVALACKAGFDYFKMQLRPDFKVDPDWFYYHPRVANCLDALREIERRGVGMVLDVDNGGEEGEESGEGSARDSWASQPGDGKDEEVRSEPQSTPLPTPTVAVPPRSASTPRSSAAPTSSPTSAPSRPLESFMYLLFFFFTSLVM